MGLAQVVAVLVLLVVMGHPAQSRATPLVGLGLHLLLRARLPSMGAVAAAAEAQVLILVVMVAAEMAAHHRQARRQARPTQAVVVAVCRHQELLLVQAAQASSSSLTLARNYSLAARLQLLVVTPSTHLIQVVL
jgi:hypothetical protein